MRDAHRRARGRQHLPPTDAGCTGRRARDGEWRTVRFCRARRTSVSTRLTAISLSSPGERQVGGCVSVWWWRWWWWVGWGGRAGRRGGGGAERRWAAVQLPLPDSCRGSQDGVPVPAVTPFLPTRCRLVHEQHPWVFNKLHTDCRKGQDEVVHQRVQPNDALVQPTAGAAGCSAAKPSLPGSEGLPVPLPRNPLILYKMHAPAPFLHAFWEKGSTRGLSRQLTRDAATLPPRDALHAQHLVADERVLAALQFLA